MNDRDLLETIRPLIGYDETGDDCAAFPLNKNSILVSSVDMLHESTDFPSGMTDYEIGWMSVAVSLSDVASCGAQPKQVLVAVGLDDSKRLYNIMRGSQDCAKAFGAIVSGGDIDSHSELTVVTTAFGIVSSDTYKRRSGASVGDQICVTGVPGRAQAALDGHVEFQKYLFMPIPQVHEGIRIAPLASAMMDVSDGLVISLYDLVIASGVGASLYSSLFNPFDSSSYAQSCYLYGGGDFGLLFTLPPNVVVDGVDYTVIGTIVEGSSVSLDGKILPRKGYTHSWE